MVIFFHLLDIGDIGYKLTMLKNSDWLKYIITEECLVGVDRRIN